MRVYKWSTVDGVFYAYADGTKATKAEWDAQCRRWDEEQAEREREDALIQRKTVCCFPLKWEGGVSVDSAGNIMGYRSEGSRRLAHACGE